ncbi:MAG TPA: alpha/beta hydrolase [Myxococcales bacterium]
MKLDGLEIETQHFGPRAGPQLVFLHEGLGSLGQWRDFPAKVSEATGYGAFVYSRAGYGKSDPERMPRPVTYMHEEARKLPRILEEAGITDPILVGHSDGASIAILYAGAHSCRALILEAPHVFTEEPGLRSIEKARDAYLNGDLKQRLSRWHKDVDAAFWGWNGPWLHPDFRAFNIESSLPNIRAPILVIQGENDEYGTLAQVDAIARQAPRAETLLLPDCGHAPHKDQPEATLAAIARFLNAPRAS